MGPGWVTASLDAALMLLHLLVIGINVFGWIPRRTRRLQRWVLLLTTLSWLGLGMFYGIGYCFLTDWHWTIKRMRGEYDLPASFIQYLLHNKLGFTLADFTVDVITGTVFVLLLLITGAQLFYSRRKPPRSFHGQQQTNPSTD